MINVKFMFNKLKTLLSKTRSSFSSGWHKLLGKTVLDDETLETLETLLLKADLGIPTTEKLLEQLKKRMHKAQALLPSLQQLLLELIMPCEQNFAFTTTAKPRVILMVGINGAGKTTSMAKLAHAFQQHGQKVLLACGDTFRAAATEQLNVWAKRLNIPSIYQAQGADSASVIFDALQSAQAKGMDVVLADTAGRLHTKQNLLEELKKIIRVLKKLDPAAPHDIILVLDASIGQNALRQLEEFHQAVSISGLILTKLDGTAKGGIVFALADRFQIPIYFLGTGEGIDDLLPFSASDFVASLFEEQL